MATAPRSMPREATAEVTQFVQLGLALIDAAGTYAASGVYNPEYDAMMRQQRVVTGALQAGLNNIPFNMPQPPTASSCVAR